MDFVKTVNLPLLNQLFAGRALLSDFVVKELADAEIAWNQAEVVLLTSEAELQLFEDIRRNNPPLGIGEVGAITVARLRGGGLISNDRQARRAAGELLLLSLGKGTLRTLRRFRDRLRRSLPAVPQMN